MYVCIYVYPNLPIIQSEYRKIRTRKKSVFGHFSRSAKFDALCVLGFVYSAV